MGLLILHHYGFLTSDSAGWLEENEIMLGKPFKIHETVRITSQKVNITFIQQSDRDVFIELIEPWEENAGLRRLINKGVTIYHAGYLAAPGKFDDILESLDQKGIHILPPFLSEAFGGKRCVFTITKNIGMTEIIEQ